MTAILRALLFLGLYAATAGASRAAQLADCRLGVRASHPVAVLAAQPIAGSHIIYLQDGKTLEPLFGSGENDDSRAASLKLSCVGQAEKLLVLAGEFFGSGYPKGAVIRYQHGRRQRLDFAERAYPHTLYVSARGMRIYIERAFPAAGKKWVVYRYDSVAGQSMEEEYACCLPPTRQGEVRYRLKPLPQF